MRSFVGEELINSIKDRIGQDESGTRIVVARMVFDQAFNECLGISPQEQWRNYDQERYTELAEKWFGEEGVYGLKRCGEKTAEWFIEMCGICLEELCRPTLDMLLGTEAVDQARQ